jgi:mercuric ion transport protein
MYWRIFMKNKLISFFALFGSTGTLICCVLPAIVATIAGGAAVGAMLTMFPWMITLSHYKLWIFVGSALLIALNGILVLKPNSDIACTLNGGKGCEVTGTFSTIMFWAAVIIYSIGFFFSYLLVPILRMIG